VTADEAAALLRCSPITVKRLAREGKIPGHCIQDGIRKRWRFLLSELAATMKSGIFRQVIHAAFPQRGRVSGMTNKDKPINRAAFSGRSGSAARMYGYFGIGRAAF